MAPTTQVNAPFSSFFYISKYFHKVYISFIKAKTKNNIY